MDLKRPYEIRVVLVRTLYERNIGSVSRAMSNMGAHQLILIDPRCEITYEAQLAAATGQSGLQNRIIYSSWKDFNSHEPESVRISFTTRDGKGRSVLELNNVYQNIKEHSPFFRRETTTPFPVHLIFGPEDWGLSGTDLENSHVSAFIPTFGDNLSLNLAQAVLIGLYDLRKSWGGQQAILDGQQPQRISEFPDHTLKLWLETLGFDLSKRRINVYTVLRRMLLQNTPTQKELSILETVLQQNIRKLREWKNK